LGVDPGYKKVGLSATTENKVLFEAEAELRTDIVKLLSAKHAYRKTRRNRKTRYRKARFLNRRKKSRLAPSVENRVSTHIKLISLARSILPITKTIIEVASFDIQKIKNPAISGKEYQEGEQLGFWNVREYVLWRDSHTCRSCKGKSKDKRLTVHHIESRKTGGDSPGNLITLCETCHKGHHKGVKKLNITRGKPFKAATFMGIVRWEIHKRLKDCETTFGYITKNTRITNGLPKTHRADARCISGNPKAMPGAYYLIKQVRGQNRQLHKAAIRKGLRQSNKAPKYVHGYQIFDKVSYRGQECFIFGRRTSGYFDLRLLDGTKIHRSANVKELMLLVRAKTLLIEKRKAV